MIKRWMGRLHRPVYEKRVEVLAREILRHLFDGDRVLDAGCGSGRLGEALMEKRRAGLDFSVEGLEAAPRGETRIPVTAYEGDRFPFADRSFDVVILADVLHHEESPEKLMRECVRVSRRLVIVKDHQREGMLAQARIALIDWAANNPYGVKCLFRYLDREGWARFVEDFPVAVAETQNSMNLYPPFVDFLFGRRLHVFMVLEVKSGASV